MAQTLEAIKGGGGSIRVGTTGTINALMSRELRSDKVASPRAVGDAMKSPKRAVETNDPATVTNPKTNAQADEASTSSSSNNGHRVTEKPTSVSQKAKHQHARRDSRNPFLRSDNASADANGSTPGRKKNDKKGSCMVDIVDVKCGVPDKMWANPITNKLKKLTFSKLSEANGVK